MSKQSFLHEWVNVVRERPAVTEVVGASSAGQLARATTTGWRKQLLAALDAPLDAIPLSEAVYPGDKIAISVRGGIPGTSEIIAGLVEMLLAHGISPADITVFSPDTFEIAGQTDPDEADQADSKSESTRIDSGSPDSGETQAFQLIGDRSKNNQQIACVHHQTDDPQALAMVGVSRHAQPIYLNRLLAEADVVIPIVLMSEDARQTLASSIYPALSSAETQERLRGHDSEQDAESQDAENLVCPFLMVGVIPAPGGDQGEIVAGVRHSIQDYAQQRLNALWTIRAAQHPAILATFERKTEIGLWERLCHGLNNAVQLVSDQAPIILLLDDQVASGLLRHVKGKKEQRDRQHLIAELEEVTRHRPVFLASSLDAGQVEELGFGHVGSLNELAKLLDRFSPMVMLRDADQWHIEDSR